jgi:hypothetical protein
MDMDSDQGLGPREYKKHGKTLAIFFKSALFSIVDSD